MVAVISEDIFSCGQNNQKKKKFTFSTCCSLRTNKTVKAPISTVMIIYSIWLVFLFIKIMMDQGLQGNDCFPYIII